MSVREFAAGDGPSARRLWDELGGWHRNTSPAVDADVDRTIGRLLRRPGWTGLRRRAPPSEGAWVAESRGDLQAWVYARADPEQNYIVPLVPPEGAAGVVERLMDLVREWFRSRGVDRFVVDVPTGRSDLHSAFQREGRILWHRAILDRDLGTSPTDSGGPGEVRPFRRPDLAAAQSLFKFRHPEASFPPIPVAFLELRGGWVRDPAWEMERSIWIAGPTERLLGIAGGTYRYGAPYGFLGPWVLAPSTPASVASRLLGAVFDWLRALGARRIRTTVPMPPGEDARTLERNGFSTLAEGDLFELKS